MSLRIRLLLLLLPSLALSSVASAQRVTADRADDLQGPQIHIAYVLPLDGVDEALDTNGTIARSVAAVRAWFHTRSDGRHLRIDTFNGAPDVTFIRLQRTNADIQASGAYVRDQIEAELRTRGFLAQADKLWGVYYGGGSTWACGGGAFPPSLPGQVGALYLKGTPTGFSPCATQIVGASASAPGYWEFALIHELVHTMGFVPGCAPNVSTTAHVGDEPRDLMYAGSSPWRPTFLDWNHDDYYGHSQAACPDLADSGYLTAPARQLTFDFGSAYGLYRWRLNDAGAGEWTALHALSPAHHTTGDLDGNGLSDVIADFSGYGVYAWMNGASWVPLTSAATARMLTADTDGNGRAELIVEVPGAGLWRYLYGVGWSQLHPVGATNIVAGNFDGDANLQDDLAIDFPGYGIWILYNGVTWAQLHPQASAYMAAGDIDASGRTDLLIDFPGAGIWARMNNTTWTQVHPLNSAGLALGNVNGDPYGTQDVVINFPTYGVWRRVEGTTWIQLHAATASSVATADIDNNGSSDILLGFAEYGTWAWRQNIGWLLLHPFVPEELAAGLFNR